jgi:integrase
VSTTTLKPHGRPAMPVGTHGTIRTEDLGEHVTGKRYRAVCLVRDKDGKTRKLSRRGTSKSKATAAIQEALRERIGMASVRLRPESRFALAAQVYVEQLKGQVAKAQLSPTSADRYEAVLNRHVLPRIGDLRLHEIDPGTLDDLLDELPIGAAARRQVRVVLRGVMQVALRRRAVGTNPARELSQIRGDRSKQPRALTADEREQLLAKLRADQYARRCDLIALVLFMLGTGVRIGEALAVRWCDINLDGMLIDGHRTPVVHITGNIVNVRGQGLIRHSGKTAAARRVIPLPAFVVAMLRKRSPRLDQTPLFPAERLDAWRWPSNVQRAWRGARQRAGFDWVTPHVFRKTASTELERMGLTVRQRADILGHADLTTTQNVYTGRGEIHAEAAAALDAAYGSI